MPSAASVNDAGYSVKDAYGVEPDTVARSNVLELEASSEPYTRTLRSLAVSLDITTPSGWVNDVIVVPLAHASGDPELP